MHAQEKVQEPPMLVPELWLHLYILACEFGSRLAMAS